MHQLRKLDLQLALESPCSLGENVENKTVAIEHAHFELGLKISLLTRREPLPE
jgi:hypothetical protein